MRKYLHVVIVAFRLALGGFVTVPAGFILVCAAAAASGCMSRCQSAAAGMPRAIVGKITLGSFCQCLVVNDDDTIAGLGSRFASVQVEATPRVDVEKTPHAAAAPAPKYLLASSGDVWTEFWGVPGGKREKLDSFVVFVVSLGGSTVQVRVEGNDSYESFAAKVAAKVNLPECHWYLTFSGRDLRHMPCPTSVLHRDSLFVCSQDSWVVLLSSPLQESGSVERVIEEDAGLLVVLASVAWHRGQRKAPPRFSLCQGAPSEGKACFGKGASTQSQATSY